MKRLLVFHDPVTGKPVLVERSTFEIAKPDSLGSMILTTGNMAEVSETTEEIQQIIEEFDNAKGNNIPASIPK